MEDQTLALAERMFNAYNAQGPNPWKTFDGRDVPRWNEINDQVRAKWRAAAEESQRKEDPTKVPGYWCDVCPHAMGFHNPDGSCGCGTDCAAERSAKPTF